MGKYILASRNDTIYVSANSIDNARVHAIKAFGFTFIDIFDFYSKRWIGCLNYHLYYTEGHHFRGGVLWKSVAGNYSVVNQKTGKLTSTVKKKDVI